ncbi:DUF6174 domain-containing protein [Kangiella sp. TOML190]|uniref:DUF6174 domain-containing protein n=1 Tax=Kangiella sp. TOML190 TaxID=2931351 RepID=UPI00203F1FA4|nr:DUF6174 domain-containing protein [Kangiella sp. TOML190]
MSSNKTIGYNSLCLALSLVIFSFVGFSGCQASKSDTEQSSKEQQTDASNVSQEASEQESRAEGIASGVKFVDDRTATRQAFFANQQKWQAHALQNYSVNFQRSCFCPREFVQPLKLTIADGKVTTVMDSKSEAVGEQVAQSTKTVSQVFAMIEKALDKAEQIEVKYDPQFGYPSQLFIDRSKRMADEEVRISFKDLRF